jgi:hypothetical protein
MDLRKRLNQEAAKSKLLQEQLQGQDDEDINDRLIEENVELKVRI